MAHEITIRADGFAEAAFSLEPAWHGLGTTLDHVMSSEEALKTAGLDWTVGQWPVAISPPRAESGGAWDWRPVASHLCNVRLDTEQSLGMVTDGYKLVQNSEAFQFLDALVENHEMLYESAFSLRGGKKVVMLAQMPGVKEVVPGDHVLPYILMSLSHDGTEAIRFGPVATRVVCANTYAMAVGEGTTKEMAIRHTGDIQAKLAQARNILAIANQQFAQYAEVGGALARRQLSVAEWNQYLDIMCPMPDPRDPDYTPRRAVAIDDTRMAIQAAYGNARQATAPRSLWAAYNAVVEHIDHLPRRGATRERRAEARFSVCLYGPGRDMKKRALQTACRFAEIECAV